MHFYNLIPFILTVPMAAFYGYYTYTPGTSVRTIPDAEFESPSCNCTKPFRFKEAGLDIMSKLTEINIPKESRLEILNMLDNLHWVKVKPSCNSREANFDFIRHFLDNKTDLFWLLAINSCSFMILHAIAQETIFGMMLKIFLNHTSDFARQVHKSSTDMVRKSVMSIKKITAATVTTDDDESQDDGDGDDDVFHQCSSTILLDIEKEEVHPKASDPEERLDFCSGDRDCDGGSLSESDSRPFLNVTSSLFPAQEDVDQVSDVDPQTVEVNTPERFRKFLHQKHEDVEKLGIGLTDLDDGLVDRHGRMRAHRSNM